MENVFSSELQSMHALANFATPVGVTDRCKTRRCTAIDSLALRRRHDGSDQRLRPAHLGNRLPTPQRRLTANQPTNQPHPTHGALSEVGWLVTSCCGGHRGIRSLRHLVPSRLPCRVTSTSSTGMRTTVGLRSLPIASFAIRFKANHTVPLCLGVRGPGIAELCSVASRVAS
jgi:hypothetical protein